MANKNRASSTTTSRRDSAARKAEAARVLAERRKQERKRALLWQGGVAVILIAIVAAVAVGVLQQRDQAAQNAGATPPGLTSDGAIRFGSADAKVTIQAVEDFQCPACKNFESTSGSLLEQYRTGNDVAVEYRPISFLDASSTTKYSSRALNASMCVLQESGKDVWMKYHEALYANQPQEGTAGLPDSELISMAKTAGATGSGLSQCVEDKKYDGWIKRQTDASSEDGVQSTPTLFVNGKKISDVSPAGITKAVQDAQSS